jgi:hypothetical protein
LVKGIKELKNVEREKQKVLKQGRTKTGNERNKKKGKWGREVKEAERGEKKK